MSVTVQFSHDLLVSLPNLPGLSVSCYIRYIGRHEVLPRVCPPVAFMKLAMMELPLRCVPEITTIGSLLPTRVAFNREKTDSITG